jgi:hypothetical protein|tara:strand:+ start:899 stop:1132 length:234 start_codon:yes stop_codon:yes gene_type:complete
MKILGENKKGTKILLNKEEAIMVFTKDGVKISAPQALLKSSLSEEEAFEYIKKNNPTLNIFMDLMNHLHEKHGGDIK